MKNTKDLDMSFIKTVGDKVARLDNDHLWLFYILSAKPNMEEVYIPLKES